MSFLKDFNFVKKAILENAPAPGRVPGTYLPRIIAPPRIAESTAIPTTVLRSTPEFDPYTGKTTYTREPKPPEQARVRFNNYPTQSATPTTTTTAPAVPTAPAAPKYGIKDTLSHAGLGLSGVARTVATGYRDKLQGETPDGINYPRLAGDLALGSYDVFDALGKIKNKTIAGNPKANQVLPHATRGFGRQALTTGLLTGAPVLFQGGLEGGAKGFREAIPEAAQYVAPSAGIYAATKLLGKAAPRIASKFVPGLGSAFSAVSAKNRYDNKDYLGAGLDTLSGSVNWIPGFGGVASNVIDAVNAARDIYNIKNAPAKVQNPQTPTPVQPNLEEAQRNYPDYILDKDGIPAVAPRSLGKNSPNPQSGRIVTASHFKNLQKNNLMKTAENRFKRDLENSSAGKNSDLYNAILPIISGNSDDQLSGYDASRTDALKEDVRRGLVGLEYMTGLKKNTGESFYDEHPAQAVVSDLLSNYGKIGLGVGGAGLLSNALRQHSNMKLTEPAKMSREKNQSHDLTHPRNLLQPTNRATRPDIARLFGDIDSNPERRLGLLDAFVNQNNGSSNLLGEYRDAQRYGRSRDMEDILNRARLSEGHSGLEKYVDLHESLQRAKQKGGFKKYVGEKLNSLPPGPVNDLLKKLAPNSEQAVADLLEKYRITGAHPNFDEALIRDIVKEYRGGKSLTADPQGQAFIDKTLKNIRDPKYQGSGMRRFLGANKLPIAAGAVAGLGSAGLYALIKALQEKMYSKDKTNEWKKTLLQARGDFDSAAKIQ